MVYYADDNGFVKYILQLLIAVPTPEILKRSRSGFT